MPLCPTPPSICWSAETSSARDPSAAAVAGCLVKLYTQSTPTRRLLHRFTYFFVQILSPVIHTFAWDRPRGSIPRPETRQQKVVKKSNYFSLRPRFPGFPIPSSECCPHICDIYRSPRSKPGTMEDKWGNMEGEYVFPSDVPTAQPLAETST